MRAYLHTWKYGNQEKTMVYHGSWIRYDATNAVLIVDYPVLGSGLGLQTVVHLINTDELTIERCVPHSTNWTDDHGGNQNVPPCLLHAEGTTEKLAENLVV